MLVNEKTAAGAIQKVARKYHVSEDEVRREITAVLPFSPMGYGPAPSAETLIADIATCLLSPGNVPKAGY